MGHTTVFRNDSHTAAGSANVPLHGRRDDLLFRRLVDVVLDGNYERIQYFGRLVTEEFIVVRAGEFQPSGSRVELRIDQSHSGKWFNTTSVDHRRPNSTTEYICTNESTWLIRHGIRIMDLRHCHDSLWPDGT